LPYCKQGNHGKIIDVNRNTYESIFNCLTINRYISNLYIQYLMLISLLSLSEPIVFETYSAPPLQFILTGEHECSVMDSQKRSLVLVQNSTKLHAVLQQGGSTGAKVYLNMLTYVHPVLSTEARPVVLGIRGTNIYLSCHLEDDEPKLHLEVVEDKNSLLRINKESEMLRFLFYKQDSGVSISTLMSARFPSWYISTVEEDNKAVIMCQETSSCYQTFNIQSESKNLSLTSAYNM
uniref:Interleukin-1 n=1 Tax=Gouania willdenowi TaxID=441366 RepID=A0A8C5H4U4_GOUWI